MNKEKLRSEIVSDFLNLIKDCQNKEEWLYESLTREDKLTQDLLHELELGDYKTRSKIATALSINRKDRRYYKDQKEEVDIIVDWAEEFKDAVEKLKQTLGKIRKIESYHADRTYHPRILKGE